MSRLRASRARASEARWRGKSKRRVTSKDSLFHHNHHPNFYDFFPRAIAPFTGKTKEVMILVAKKIDSKIIVSLFRGKDIVLSEGECFKVTIF